MNGVIIEYKGQNRMRIVEPAAERRAREYINAHHMRKSKEKKVHGTLMGSPDGESIRRPWWKLVHTDRTSWKNQKHARKNWMRHLHRLKPSASVLIDRCIYPEVNSFVRG